MSDWWDNITDNEVVSCIFCNDDYFCPFPSSENHYVDRKIHGKRLSYPDFDKVGWEGLQREEFSRDDIEVMWYTTSAKGVRWVGSDTNRMEICYASAGNWYFACKQGEQFFSVAVIGCHPEVHCNNFVFCNSDGSSEKSVDLNNLKDPYAVLQTMLSIADSFIRYQRH